MAAGDVINVNMSGTFNFQPAAGVAIFVLRTFMNNDWDNAKNVGFQDGVTTTTNFAVTISSTPTRSLDTSRFAINNTNYYYNNSSQPVIKGFSGIQIK